MKQKQNLSPKNTVKKKNDFSIFIYFDFMITKIVQQLLYF